MVSKEMSKETALIELATMETAEAVIAFIEGETRKKIITAANDKLKELSAGQPKAGEVKSITQETSDFKGHGVQKIKDYVTGEDVLKSMRERGIKI